MATYDFQARQGATFDRSFTWKPGGVAADLSGFTARMQVRRTVRSTEPVVFTNVFNTAFGATPESSASNSAALLIARAGTSSAAGIFQESWTADAEL